MGVGEVVGRKRVGGEVSEWIRVWKCVEKSKIRRQKATISASLIRQRGGQDAQPRAVGFYCEQSTSFQFGLNKTQRRNRLRHDALRTEIHATDLHDAGLFSVCDSKDRTEIEVMRDHNIIVGSSIGEYF